MDKIPRQCPAKADACRVITFDRDRSAICNIAGKRPSGRNACPARSDGKGTVNVAVIV